MLSLLFLQTALAGDRELYARAIGVIEDHYLHVEDIDRAAMFREAGLQLESRVEWLLVDAAGATLHLTDGTPRPDGGWRADVTLQGDLPAALARLEDAVTGAGPAIDPKLDLRVEILRGIARTLDRHSVILHADGLDRFDERLSGTLSGIGATISPDARGLVVSELVPNAPAQRAGLIAQDRILKIDGVSTVGMTASVASTRIRGVAGSFVTLGLERGGAPLDVRIGREEIAIRNVTAARGPQDVGVVSIDHFSERTGAWLADALGELADMGILANGLIIDLRGNTGGSLLQSAEAADTFLQSGVIVTTAGREGRAVPGLVARIAAEPDAPPYAMPIAVLMDHSTASGSEILAGALARLDRALLLGTNSFGKGTVQKVYELDPHVKLKLTVAEYRLDGERTVNEIGLQPDIALEPVRFLEGRVWYPSPAREWARLPTGTPILWYAVDEGREAPPEIAAHVLLAAAGGGRHDLIDAANAVKGPLGDIEEARLIDAFEARGIDWRAAPPGATGTSSLPTLSLGFSAPPAAGEATELRATLQNRGPAIYRAAVRLSSVNPLWDDCVIPLGFVPPGGTATATTRITPEHGAPARSDQVIATLEADGRAPEALRTEIFATIGGASPMIALRARARTPDGDRVRVAVEVENRGGEALEGVTARFLFPDRPGIELFAGADKPLRIAPRATARVTLDVRVSAEWTEATLPLDLVVESDDYQRLGTFSLDIPRDGRSLRAEPPVLTLGALPAVARPGTLPFHLRATDDRALDHLLVFQGPETMDRRRSEPSVEHRRDKVAYHAATGRRAELDLVLDVVPGANHYVVVAEDDRGLRTVRDLYVLGEDGDAPAAVQAD